MSDPPDLDARPASPTGAAPKRRDRRVPEPPSVAEAERRLAAYAAAPLSPWLTPEALAAAKDLPEVCGPATFPPARNRPSRA